MESIEGQFFNEGYKDLLVMYISKNEGANFWLSVLTDLQNSGVLLQMLTILKPNGVNNILRHQVMARQLGKTHGILPIYGWYQKTYLYHQYSGRLSSTDSQGNKK